MTSPPDPAADGTPGALPAADTSADESAPHQRSSWVDLLPWDGKAARGDKALVAAVFGLAALMLASRPFRPFLLARHPVLLEVTTGSLSSIGAGAAFARVGDLPLWLVVLAGAVGLVKADWLFWWAGRRWGTRVLTVLAPGARTDRLVRKLQTSHPLLLRLSVVAGPLPGVPAAAVYALAGAARMRLVTFLLLDAVGAALMVGLVAGLGYSLGQRAIDVVLLVDRYAIWVSLAAVVVAGFAAGRRGAHNGPSPAAPSAEAADQL